MVVFGWTSRRKLLNPKGFAMKDLHQIVQRDLEILELMVAEMDEYMMSEATHWVMARGDMPKLTIGGCLMRLNRLPIARGPLQPEEQSRLEDAARQFDGLIANHTVRFEQRVHQELRARLAQWSGYLGHLTSRTLADLDYYASVVDTRVVIAEMVNKLRKRPYRQIQK